MNGTSTRDVTESLLEHARDRVHLACVPADRTLCGLPLEGEEGPVYLGTDCSVCELADGDPTCPFSGTRCICQVEAKP